jgi:hypothetical protein
MNIKLSEAGRALGIDVDALLKEFEAISIRHLEKGIEELPMILFDGFVKWDRI